MVILGDKLNIKCSYWKQIALTLFSRAWFPGTESYLWVAQGCPGVTVPGCLFTPAPQGHAVPTVLSSSPGAACHPAARMESQHTAMFSSSCLHTLEVKAFSTHSQAACVPLHCSQVCFFPHPSLSTQQLSRPRSPSLLPVGTRWGSHCTHGGSPAAGSEAEGHGRSTGRGRGGRSRAVAAGCDLLPLRAHPQRRAGSRPSCLARFAPVLPHPFA